MTLKLNSLIAAGYNCVDNPCGKRGCGTRPGASHGVHGDEWLYSVSDGEVALVLTVYSGQTPRRPAEPASGSVFNVHLSFPIEVEWLRSEPHYDSSPCEFLGELPCIAGEPRYNAAKSFFAERGVDRYEQPMTFWAALEAEFARVAAEARAARVDLTHRRCSCCNGSGIVEAKDG